MPLLIGMIACAQMDGGEFPKRCHLPEPLRCAFSSSERLLRVSARLFGQRPVSWDAASPAG
jgi:hypothetical protein